MSLLLQALQKASKDRDNNTGGSAVEGADDDDLALEPMPEPQSGQNHRRRPTMQRM
jgi:hypothetical protein